MFARNRPCREYPIRSEHPKTGDVYLFKRAKTLEGLGILFVIKTTSGLITFMFLLAVFEGIILILAITV